VLGRVLRQVGPDFETQYGYRPWLIESFVDTEQFLGTCYKATHWSAIGPTQGRGRQDRTNHSSSGPSTDVAGIHLSANDMRRLCPWLEKLWLKIVGGKGQG
jgi:hypothetical protein